jgi:hypothetical protein
MKYLLLLLIVLISLCVQLPEIPAQPGAVTVDRGSPDIFINVETRSSEIKSGRNATVYFELRNKQSYDLKNVRFEVYDHPCFTSGDFSKDITTLKSNQSVVWSSRWTSDKSTIDRQCPIKFSTSYEATNSIYQDIAVLSQAEYDQREEAGTLQNIPIQSSSARGPLNIYLTFSEPQPFIANQEYTMYINYYNTGDGLLGDLNGNIFLTPPNNINLNCGTDYLEKACGGTAKTCGSLNYADCTKQKVCSLKDNLVGDVNGDCIVNQTDVDLCKQYFFENWPPCDWNNDTRVDIADLSIININWGKYCPCQGTATQCSSFSVSECTTQFGCSVSSSLNRTLTFIKGKALRSECTFSTLSVSAMDIKSFNITANYKYVLYNSIPITVKA